MLIQVYEHEHIKAKDNKLLAKFELTNILSTHQGIPEIEITFIIDVNGILNVHALKRIDTFNEIIIRSEKHLSKEEIELMINNTKDENKKCWMSID